MFFGESYAEDTENFLKDDKPANIPLKSHYSHQEKKPQKFEYEPIYNNRNISKKKKSNKRVKFNDKVDVVNVESYKEYNKIEDVEINFQEYLLQIQNYSNMSQNNDNNNVNDKKKKCDNCTCYII